jgi:hypothetical protein
MSGIRQISVPVSEETVPPPPNSGLRQFFWDAGLGRANGMTSFQPVRVNAISTPIFRFSENSVTTGFDTNVAFWSPSDDKNAEVLGYTPTISDVFKQIIALQTDLAVNHIRVTESVGRLLSSASDGGAASAQSMSNVIQPGQEYSPDLNSRLVPVPLVSRVVSVGVLVICLFSLLIWTLSGFVIINPALSIIVSIGAIFLVLVSNAEMAALRKKRRS